MGRACIRGDLHDRCMYRSVSLPSKRFEFIPSHAVLWNKDSNSHGSKYRLGVREVNIQDMKLSYLSYGDDDGLCDGKNVRNCYRLVTSVDRISMVYGSIY